MLLDWLKGQMGDPALLLHVRQCDHEKVLKQLFDELRNKIAQFRYQKHHAFACNPLTVYLQYEVAKQAIPPDVARDLFRRRAGKPTGYPLTEWLPVLYAQVNGPDFRCTCDCNTDVSEELLRRIKNRRYVRAEREVIEEALAHYHSTTAEMLRRKVKEGRALLKFMTRLNLSHLLFNL
jgi:hypothetical protein